MRFTPKLIDKASAVINKFKDAKLKIAVAESCTGGMLGSLLTAVPGSSSVFDRGFITYSNEAKSDLLKIPMELIQRHGAVSQIVAEAMASGALNQSLADRTIAITGVAGPGGGSAEKPVGTVYIAIADALSSTGKLYQFNGDRHEIRLASTEVALKLLMN